MSSANDIFNVTLSTEDKLSKAKIRLHKEYPFFSYLVEHLRIQEDTNNRLSSKTMGVDEKGRLYYDKAFVDKIGEGTGAQLLAVLAHEVMHPAFRHFTRQGHRHVQVNGQELFNVACDVSVNHIIVEEGLELPSLGIIPKDGKVTVYGITVENIGDKMAEEIYEELLAGCLEQVKQGKMKQVGGPNGDMTNGGKSAGGFDDHLKSGDDDGDGEGKGDKEGEEDGSGQGDDDAGIPSGDWIKIVAEAMEHAKRIGKLPAGMQRQYDELHKSKLNWRAIIRRTVASKIPFDYSYVRPSRRYIVHDLYLPVVVGEKIKVICSIDTSGSISEKELSSFISEMIGISRSFSFVEFVILTHDVEVHDDITIADNTIRKLRSIKVHGGGGTSHKPLFKYIKKNRKKWNTKLLVSFTDGYSDFPDKPDGTETIFVLGGSHAPRESMPKWAKTICLE
jgi:predicted metal-dependent peptidase